MDNKFPTLTFAKRVKSMLSVDFKRLFCIPFFYIMVGIAFVVPILILVMTTMMDGSVTVNPQTGVESTMEGFKNVFEIFGTVSTSSQEQAGAGMGMDMSLTSMCNINLIYFAIAVLVCVFVSDDFRSGYAKNLFTVRSLKSDYVISKTLICFLGSGIMFIAFTIGAILGGKIAGLPFTTDGFNMANFTAMLTGKILLSLVFVAVFLTMSVIGKQKLWLSMILSFGVSTFIYAMVPMITPLNSTILNVILSLGGGCIFAIGLGAVSNLILKKTSLV